MSKTIFEVIEVAGIISAIEGMRYPTKSTGDSIVINEAAREVFDSRILLGTKDAKLAATLIARGPVHAKFQRGITAWFRINMPRSVWAELDTYSVGVGMISSESTMYTLLKECKEITHDMFVNYTPATVVKQFRDNVEYLSANFGSRQQIPIEVLKACLPEGWMQKRNRSFSYQSLASMYRDRKDHRMPEWRDVICKSIEQLPYFKELIIGGTNEN